MGRTKENTREWGITRRRKLSLGERVKMSSHSLECLMEPVKTEKEDLSRRLRRTIYKRQCN